MQLTVRMPDEYESLLDRLSKEMALKRSDIVRMALRHFFKEHQESPVQTPFQLNPSRVVGRSQMFSTHDLKAFKRSFAALR